MPKLTIKTISGNRAVAESGEVIRFPINVPHPQAGESLNIEAVFIIGKVAEEAPAKKGAGKDKDKDKDAGKKGAGKDGSAEGGAPGSGKTGDGDPAGDPPKE